MTKTSSSYHCHNHHHHNNLHHHHNNHHHHHHEKHHYHHRFASMGWTGSLMALFHILRSWASSELSFIFLKSLLINWDHFFLALPCSRLPSTTTCLQALAGLPASIFITCPNHLSLFLRSTCDVWDSQSVSQFI